MTGTDDLATSSAAAPRTDGSAITAMQVAGLASIGAGAVHAAAIGIHAEHTTLSRLFVAVAVVQIGLGITALVRGGRTVAALTALANVGAVVAWAITRIWGISWIEGLEEAEAPQFADAACAALGALAAGAAVVALSRRRTTVGRVRLGAPATLIGAFTVVAMLLGANHVHSEGHSHGDESAAHSHGDETATEDSTHSHGDETATEDSTHSHGDETATDGSTHSHGDETATEGSTHSHGDETATEGTAHSHGDETAAAAVWPRPWDPTGPIDFSRVPGVSAEQQARAEDLVRRTVADLPRFADVTTMTNLGYQSIGDASSGYEHYINLSMFGDDKILDPTAPESLVFQADGAERTLVSAMYIVAAKPIDDPEIVDFGGPLMQWHVHEDLCWAPDETGTPQVVGVTAADGSCPAGSVNAGGGNPMVHVWIAPNECGPFAALEGHGAGQADAAEGERTDQCAHDHGAAHDDGEDASVSLAYDPTKPIDLSGVDGVTLEQQAFAENLVARNVVELPQWSDPAVAEAAGYHSIRDGGTGHEHYINWDSIDDDVWLDPDAPESLVYEPQPDGSKKLVSAMYMLPSDVALEDVPDWGGPLMQWHIHNNLCFTSDEEAPVVAGLVNADGTCTAPLRALLPWAMIHVWITPNPCGPFAALEGVGAGQVLEGEEHLCDHVHGSG